MTSGSWAARGARRGASRAASAGRASRSSPRTARSWPSPASTTATWTCTSSRPREGSPDASPGTPPRTTSRAGCPAGRPCSSTPGRASFHSFDRLFTMPLSGGLPQELPLPRAVQGSSSADGRRLAYVADQPVAAGVEATAAGRRPRSGSPISRTPAVEAVPRANSNDPSPVGRRPRVLPVRPERPRRALRLRHEDHRSLNKEIIATLKNAASGTHRVDVEAMTREARAARAKFTRQISDAEINAWKRAGRP